MRLRFYRWLMRLFKIPEGSIPPRFFIFVRRLLWPLRYFYAKQSQIRYDALIDCYIINNIKFYSGALDALTDVANTGRTFTILKIEDGTITLQFIDDTLSGLIKKLPEQVN